ncbi:iron-sulfur cluster insertion protein ErpA [Shumkonia mesophila]|uniref:iron-sulfur cluster insertion protein ErpA n=1 Tax=Shumkonia mesophila TaxID=2838854 RepID=UPI0029352F01|nr:iron-sulfur cluster insertion protein ErpA [Shumkonia mesophila]
MPDTPLATADTGLRIADSAARRIAHLVKEEKTEGLMLRVTVSGGGCSGFQYGFGLDTDSGEDDVVFETAGARVVVDRMSLDLLAGAELIYVDDLMGSYFKLDNPNAASTCGCGSSFSI